MVVYADASMRQAWVLTAVAIQNDRIQLAKSGLGPELISSRGFHIAGFISRGFRTFAARNSKIAAS
jgi:hypothetical protein